jgi:hypothetical protein
MIGDIALSRFSGAPAGHGRSWSSARLNFHPREFPFANRESFSNSAASAFRVALACKLFQVFTEQLVHAGAHWRDIHT